MEISVRLYDIAWNLPTVRTRLANNQDNSGAIRENSLKNSIFFFHFFSPR